MISQEQELIITVPDAHKQYELVQYAISGLWIMESNSKNLNAWKKKLPIKRYSSIEIIGHVESDLGNFKLKIIN